MNTEKAIRKKKQNKEDMRRQTNHKMAHVNTTAATSEQSPKTHEAKIDKTKGEINNPMTMVEDVIIPRNS